MLDPQIPGCDINKMIPDDGTQNLYSSDDVFTLYHCHTRQQIQSQWKEKLKKGGFNRYGILGEIDIEKLPSVQLAVSWRRYQQFNARDVSSFKRIASPLVDATGPVGLNAVLGAYGEYRSEGIDAA